MCIMTISILMGAAFIEVNTKGILHATFNPEADFFKQPLVSLIFVKYFPCQIHRFILIVMLLSCQALVYGHTESSNGCYLGIL